MDMTDRQGGCPYGYANGRYYYDGETIHTAVFAPSGVGKTRRVTYQMVHLLALAGESMVIFDTKGSLHAFMRPGLEKMGYKVFCHDWMRPHLSDQRNQLDTVTDACMGGNLSQAALRAGDLSYILIPHGERGEKFWNDISRALLKSFLLLVATADIDRSYKTMSNVKLNMTELCEVDRSNTKTKTTLLDKAIASLDYSHPARDAYSPVKAAQAASQLTASVFTTALTALEQEGDPNIAGMSQESSYDLESLGYTKSAVFLIVPSERRNYSHYPVVYLQQLYEALAAAAKATSGAIPVRTNFVLEEMGQLPQIMDLPQKISEAREYNIRYICFLQAISQISSIYGRDMAQTIMENLRAKIFLGTGDPETAQYFERLSGRYTIEVNNTAKSTRRSFVMPSMEGSDTAATSLAGRPLIMADELLRWHPDRGALVFRSGQSPACFPCPDLIKTPANAFFGMGSREHNARLYERRMKEYLSGEPKRIAPKAWVYGKGIIKDPEPGISDAREASRDAATPPPKKLRKRRGKGTYTSKQTVMPFSIEDKEV